MLIYIFPPNKLSMLDHLVHLVAVGSEADEDDSRYPRNIWSFYEQCSHQAAVASCSSGLTPHPLLPPSVSSITSSSIRSAAEGKLTFHRRRYKSHSPGHALLTCTRGPVTCAVQVMWISSFQCLLHCASS